MFTTNFQITLNGESYAVSGDDRLVSLIDSLKLKRGRVAVEINREIVPKANWDRTRLAAGDIVEIVNFVGGG
jgi:thiamine biosynthesis protein ThiS